MLQRENSTADGLTADRLIAKDPSVYPPGHKMCQETPIEILFMIL